MSTANQQDQSKSPARRVLDRVAEERFTGLLRVRSREASGEFWFLAGILENAQFGVSKGEEAIERLLRATEVVFEAELRLPHPTAGFKKRMPASGTFAEIRPVALMRYCETVALTCLLELKGKERTVRIAYKVGDLLSADADNNDALPSLLESEEGSYEFVLPAFELPPGVQASASASMPSLAERIDRTLAEQSAAEAGSAGARDVQTPRGPDAAEAQRKADAPAEAQRRAEEAAAEAKRKAEQAAATEAKRRADAAAAEAKRKAEEIAEAKRKADAAADAKRRADEAAAEAKRKADEAAAEAKRKADEVAEAKRRAGEAEAKRKADETVAAEAKRTADEAAAEAKRAAEKAAAAETERDEAAAEAKRKAEQVAQAKSKADDAHPRAAHAEKAAGSRKERELGKRQVVVQHSGEESEPAPHASGKRGFPWLLVLLALLAAGAVYYFALQRSGMH